MNFYHDVYGKMMAKMFLRRKKKITDKAHTPDEPVVTGGYSKKRQRNTKRLRIVLIILLVLAAIGAGVAKYYSDKAAHDLKVDNLPAYTINNYRTATLQSLEERSKLLTGYGSSELEKVSLSGVLRTYDMAIAATGVLYGAQRYSKALEAFEIAESKASAEQKNMEFYDYGGFIAYQAKNKEKMNEYDTKMVDAIKNDTKVSGDHKDALIKQAEELAKLRQE